MKNVCDRCGNETLTSSTSWFNTDAICETCMDKEKDYPLFNYIKHLEHQSVLKAIDETDEAEKKKHLNFNYFEDMTWDEIMNSTPDILFDLHNVKKYNKMQTNKEGPIHQFEFKFKGWTITNPFIDEMGQTPVHPIEYYGEEIMKDMIDEYKRSFISLFPEDIERQ